MTNLEVIKLYGNNSIMMEAMMGFLLLTFKDDPTQNTVDCVKKFLKSETVIDVEYLLRFTSKKDTSIEIVDVDYKENV